MNWDEIEAGSKVEAVETFEVQMGMGAPVGSGTFNVVAGDTGEVTVKRKAGKLQWLVIKWDRLGRTFNLNADQFGLIKPGGG
jgi:hypothetical protein